MKLDGLDYLDLSSHLSENEIMVQQSTRKFVDKEIIPIIDEHFENGTFPDSLTPKIADMGFFGITLPKENGGGGMNNIVYGLVCQEIERGDSGIRSFISVQSSLVMYPIHAFGSDKQREKWLPLLALGDAIGSFGLTEPNSGSDPGSMKTSAKKVDGGFILNGTKMWITNGSIADISVVWAKTEGEVVRGFLIEKGMKGFSAPEMKHKWSLRASITSELILQDVFVPEENLLPGVEGLKGPLSCLSQARYGIGWGAIGCAMAVYEASLKYAKERIQFQKPIASFQLVQEKLVWMLNEITKGQLLAYHVGKNKDSGTVTPQQISMLKRNNTWVARECVKLARELHGANGISGEYPIIRHLMNMESVYTYEGTFEMHTLILGQDITEIPAFR
ncbi:MAG: acyl-CoA dehydrogenase family protein [Candidatus Marinimicrobia bacterium]|nr:acyl-CoA dehydrogenase family protein [Candidatus Neomarinimicrobiota bacterium]